MTCPCTCTSEQRTWTHDAAQVIFANACTRATDMKNASTAEASRSSSRFHPGTASSFSAAALRCSDGAVPRAKPSQALCHSQAPCHGSAQRAGLGAPEIHHPRGVGHPPSLHHAASRQCRQEEVRQVECQAGG